MSLEIVPVHLDQAKLFVKLAHRHHKLTGPSHKFSIGVAAAGVLHGVAIVGRPVAQALQDGYTLEVVRVCTDGHLNANSMLYAAAWRAARAMGYRKLVTYTQEGESGASLRAAGYVLVHERPPRGSWAKDSVARPREERGAGGIRRYRWEICR